MAQEQHPAEARRYWRSGPTIGAFLASVLPANALALTKPDTSMEGRIAPHLPFTPTDRGMGALKTTDSVSIVTGTGATEDVPAPVFEFRLLQGPYRPDQWADLAAHVFDLTRRVNSKDPRATSPADNLSVVV